jgi:hypothetical protein
MATDSGLQAKCYRKKSDNKNISADSGMNTPRMLQFHNAKILSDAGVCGYPLYATIVASRALNVATGATRNWGYRYANDLPYKRGRVSVVDNRISCKRS